MTRYTYEGEQDRAVRSMDEAKRLVRVVKNLKKKAGLRQLTKAFDLTDGTQLYVVDLEHASYAHMITPTGSYEKKERREDKWSEGGVGIPDYLCGAVISPRIETVQIPIENAEGETEYIDKQALKNLKLTETGAKRFPDLMLARVKGAVKELSYFVSELTTSDILYSQHHGIRPAYYTGAMKVLVQVMLGIGHQSQDTYEKRWALENGKPTLTETVLTERKREVLEATEEMRTAKTFYETVAAADEVKSKYDGKSAYNLYDENAKEDVKVEVYYDWRANRTHGITWDEDGDPYVVEIGNRGVIVWPLPLDSASRIEIVKQRYIELYPELGDPMFNGQSFFDLFKGFPAPDNVPRGQEKLDEFVNAGEAVQVLTKEEMQVFYGKSLYSSGMGWAFSANGKEAHNTCHSFSHENNWQLGYYFTVHIGELKKRPPKEVSPFYGIAKAALDLAGFTFRPIHLAKLARLDDSTLEGIAEAKDPVKAFEDAEAEAEFVCTGKIIEQKKGNLYHPGRLTPTQCHLFSGQPQFKIYEPVFDALISKDFGVEDPQPNPPPRCDTPIFVCFDAQGSLHVLNYFWRKPADAEKIDYDTREFCQYGGVWEDGWYTEGTRIDGNFYSQAWDKREERAYGGASHSKYEGTFIGYGNRGPIFCAFFASHGTVQTDVYFDKLWEREMHSGHSSKVSVAVPKGSRSIYYGAYYDQKKDIIRTEGYTCPYVAGQGKNHLLVYIYEWVFHWTGVCRPSVNLNSSPGADPCVLIEYWATNPLQPNAFTCFESAPDPYLPGYDLRPCKNAKIDGPPPRTIIGAGAGPTNYNNDPPLKTSIIPPGSCTSWTRTTEPETEIKWEVRIFGDTPINGQVTDEEVLRGAKDEYGMPMDFYATRMSPWWFLPSPTACDAWAYLNVNANCFGTELFGYEPQFDANAEFVGVPTDMHVGLQSCYVGYVAP